MILLKNIINEGFIDNILSKLLSILFNTRVKAIRAKVDNLNKKLEKNKFEKSDYTKLKNIINNKEVMDSLSKNGMDKAVNDLYNTLTS